MTETTIHAKKRTRYLSPIGRYVSSGSKVIYESLLLSKRAIEALCPRHGPFMAGYTSEHGPTRFTDCLRCIGEQLAQQNIGGLLE